MTAEAAGSLKPAIEHVRPDTPVEEMLEIYRRDRALVIDELADPAELATLREAIRVPLETWKGRKDLFLGDKTQRIMGIVTRLPACRPLLADPVIVSLMEGILRRLPNMQLNATSVIAVGPGQRRQNLHRDRWPWAVLPLPDDFEYLVNCMWALTDFTTENGATHIAPDSLGIADPTRTSDVVEREGGARLPDGSPLNELDTIQATMTAGSALVWSGSLYHGGGANHTDQPRIGMSVTYTHSVLRQEENQFLIAPPEIAKDFPETLQKLLGYELANYVLGYVEGMAAPETVLRQDVE